MRKILLPTDFSENALNAIDYALRLYKDETCVFFLLNTYTPMIYNYEYQINADQFMMEAVDMVKKKSELQLETLLLNIKKKYKNDKHTFRAMSSFSILADAVIELTKEFDLDLVVMGTKGASKTREVLFGSNTTHVIKKSKCPVLAIPQNFDFEAPKEILLPTDFKTNYQMGILKPVVDIAKMYAPRINILHVFYSEDLSETQEKNKSKLDDYFANTAHLFHNVSNQKIADAVENFQLRAKVNLLVMINKRQNFFEKLFTKSSINHIALHLHIPFLIIPIK